MKRKYFIQRIFLMVFMILFLLTACEKELELVIYDKIAPGNFFKNYEDVNVAVTGIYNLLNPTTIINSHNRGNEIGTDEFEDQPGEGTSINNFMWNGDNTRYSDMYKEWVPGVSKATVVIEQLKEVNFLDESTKKRFIGELRTLRGYMMFAMLNRYGPVPVVVDKDKLMPPDNSYLPERQELSWYVDFIERDLSEAAMDLPNVADEWGRMTKGIAQTMLLKLYMHQKNWEKAASVSKIIMDLGVYSLEPEYQQIWHYYNEQNSEIIWAVPCTSDTWGHYTRAWSLPAQWPTNESKWNTFKIRWSFYDTFNPNDKRLSTLHSSFYDADGNFIDMRDPVYRFRGALPLKYTGDNQFSGFAIGNDLVMLRYADVILCRAEALNELDGPTLESIELINKIRIRAGLDNININEFNKETLRNHICDERGWEFYMEGLRREDQIRFGNYISRAKERGAPAQDYHVLFPLPTRAVLENANVKQNPDYLF